MRVSCGGGVHVWYGFCAARASPNERHVREGGTGKIMNGWGGRGGGGGGGVAGEKFGIDQYVVCLCVCGSAPTARP